MSQKQRGTVLALATLSIALAIVCGACPFSNQMILRPLLSYFDSSYVSATTDPIPFDRDLWLLGKARHRVGMAHFLSLIHI